MYGLFILPLLVLLLGQWSLCQTLPDLSDPCASSATQLHDNDIAYFPPDLLPSDESPGDRARRRRGATSVRQKLWPGGTIYYTVSGSFNEAENRTIHEAMKHWEDHTCIRFKLQTNQTYYIRFFPGFGCCSYIGRVTHGRQPQGVSLGRSCFYFHTIVHEIGHVVGFWHEQSRPDRDQYIEILQQNIYPGFEYNFRRLPSTAVDSLGVGYDYNSIMHYDPNFFSRHPSLDVLRARDPSIPVGRARELSQLDIEQANRLYNCDVNNPPPPNIVVPPLATPPPFPSLPYSCVHQFTSLEGSFQSPGYPIFAHNTDCVWMIKVSEGYQIQLTFAPVELENTGSICTKDYIKVYNNFQMTGGSQTICAFYNSYYYSVGGGSALIHYHTDSNNDLTRTRTPLAGFRATYQVTDINECVSVGCSHGCRNLPGSYECTCPRGFFLSVDGLNCFDMNECALGNGGCDHECINSGGSYRCQCRSGYDLQPDGHTCRLPGTSCSSFNGGCHHVCTEIPTTTRVCSCRAGYKLHTDGTSCIDDNECYLQRSGCQQRCTNTMGSYICSCDEAFRLAEDGHTCIPERTCAVGNGGCNQRCRDTRRGAECSCRTGYRLSVDQRTCQDINECIENRRTCQDLCTNTNGSYHCHCSQGLSLNPDQRTCSDINECLTGDNKCPFKDRCINYHGTYRCACPGGYHSTSDGQGCEDMDECALGYSAYCSHSCHNLPGSFECQCPSGYVLQDFYTCVDMDECRSRTDSCDQSSGARCQNTVGSYVCTCPDGYIVDEAGLSCVESAFGFECEFADECDEGFVCVESEGVDYMTCQCPPGHTLSSNGLTCKELVSTEATTASISTATPPLPQTTSIDFSSQTERTVSTTSQPPAFTATAVPAVFTMETTVEATTQDLESTFVPTSTLTKLSTTEQAITSSPTTLSQEPATTSAPTTPSPEQVTTSAPTTPSPEPATTSAPTTPSPEQATTSAPTTPSPEQATTSAPTTASPEQVTTSAPTTPSPKQATTSAPITTSSEQNLVTTSAPTTPSPKQATTSAPTTFSPKQVATSAPTTASPKQVTTSAPTTASPKQVATSASTTASPKQVTTSAPTTASPKQVATSAPTTPSSPIEHTTSTPTTLTTATIATTTGELSCGGDVFGESGSFHSDNWPETYPVNVDCEWRIELPDSDKVISISFDHSVFGIAGRMPECAKDWIKVYNGHSYEDSSWGPLCSFWKPKPIKTTSHRAMVVFHSGPRHNKSRKGFRLIFSSIDGPTTIPSLTTPLVTTNNIATTTTEEPIVEEELTTSSVAASMATTSGETEELTVYTATTIDTTAVTTDLSDSQEDEICASSPPPKDPIGLFECSTLLTPGFKFGTPGFPVLFNTSATTNCDWFFFGNSQRQYQLRFLYFDLPASSNCTDVNLMLYGGLNKVGEPLATLCGHLGPASRTIRGTSMMTAELNVNSKELACFRGIHALFEEVSEESLNP